MSFFQTNAVSETTYAESAGTQKAPRQEKKDEAYFEDRSTSDAPMPSDPVQVKSLAVAQFIYSLLTLTGAVLMFQLRRIGFWIYVAGVVVGLILPVSLAGLGALNTSFGVFFSMIFAGYIGFRSRRCVDFCRMASWLGAS
ncbi:hypothetical protein [Spirosoma telluris]|uniref:hypothetical protein n=1 Tax=Spirosoma telluris TaxID=2183553 RepID=UPI0018DCF354